MDKNPGITCVVNKTNIIDSTYRNFEMEVLAGENNLVTKVQAFSSWYFKFNVLKPKGIFGRNVMQRRAESLPLHSALPNTCLSLRVGCYFCIPLSWSAKGKPSHRDQEGLYSFHVHSLDLMMWI